MTVHTIDAATGQVAERFARVLGAGLTEFPITALDGVGLPVWSVWWQDGATASGGIGYGAREGDARVGALGETLEQVISGRGLRRMLGGSSPGGDGPVQGSFTELVRSRGADAVADPRTLGLPAGSDYDEARPLLWVPTTRWRDGATVLAPVEFVASSPSQLDGAALPEPLIVPVTNGQGAGSTLVQAVRHAVLEVLQRDGNGLRFRALDAGVVIDLDDVRDGGTRVALGMLHEAGVRVVAKLAATDFGLPNVYVVGAADGDDILQASACGEAVDADREVALRKALLEFASARARKRFMHGDLGPVAAVAPSGYLEQVVPQVDPAREEQRVLAAMLGWRRMPERVWRPMLENRVLARRESVAFSALPTGTGDPVERLHAAGFDVLVADHSPAGAADGDGVHAVKVLVPGLEVETVAYGRIGERNAARLLAAGRDDLVRVGDAAPGWSRVHLTPAGQERLGGPAWLDRTALAAVAGDLLPLYREPSRHATALALR